MTTFTDSVQLEGGEQRITAAGAAFYMPFSFDPTSSTQVLLGYLPPGAKVVDVIGGGGSTGGTNPTVDIGTAGDDDGFANELLSDLVRSGLAGSKMGAQWNTVISSVAATPVYGKVGASAATGGTTTGYIVYTVIKTWS